MMAQSDCTASAAGPRKILYLADHYAHPHGGTEGQLLQLIQHLDHSRYIPELAVLRPSDYLREQSFPCPVDMLDAYRMGEWRTWSRLLRTIWRWRGQGYRLVHCFFNDTSIVAPPLLRLAGIRVIVSRRDMGFWYNPGILAALRLVQPCVNHYVANSRAVKDVTQRQEWVAADKVSVIHNGYVPSKAASGNATDPLNELGIDPAQPVIGIVANLRRIKRICDLVQAMAIVSAKLPLARLVVVGADSVEEGRSNLAELQALAASLNLGSRVHFVGGQPEPMRYVRRFNVAVLCSESEGLSNSIMQYMEAGLPIVCTDTGGNGELIQHGKNGFLVGVGDSTALAARILDLLSDGGLACRLGQAARSTLSDDYSVEHMVASYMACYDHVLAGTAPVAMPGVVAGGSH